MFAMLFNLVVGCAHTQQVESPMSVMLGEWEQQGMMVVDGQLQPISSFSTCEQLTSPTDIVCTGQTSGQDAWIEVYQWDPLEERIAYQSLNTSEGKRYQGTGVWNAETQKLSIDGVNHSLTGEVEGLRIEQTIFTEGASRSEYSSVNGRKIQTRTLESVPHSSMTIDYKLPYALLNGSYKSWLRISIDPTAANFEGCRAEKQGGECETQSIDLSSKDLKQYYVYKQHVMTLEACPSVTPHAHDIMAEVQLKGQTYRNSFYYNPNGMEHHHADDACPQVSEFAEWVYQIWDERLSE